MNNNWNIISSKKYNSVGNDVIKFESMKMFYYYYFHYKSQKPTFFLKSHFKNYVNLRITFVYIYFLFLLLFSFRLFLKVFTHTPINYFYEYLKLKRKNLIYTKYSKPIYYILVHNRFPNVMIYYCFQI